jgi:transposase
MPGATQTNDQVEVPYIMRALDPEVFDAVWLAVEGLLPDREDGHPLGCHRARISDRVCFEAMLVRLVTGCSWIDAERLMGNRVSDTTLRSRRDEWIEAEVFDRLVEEALAGYDRVIGLDLSEVSIDGSQHKAPCGGEGTGKSPVDRGKVGWKWSIATDTFGIPIGWTTDGANRHDCVMVPATLEALASRGLLVEIETLHLDRGYDNSIVRRQVAAAGIADLVCAKQRRPGSVPAKQGGKKVVPLGLRWPVERTNSWFSNFGQLRRNTDRHVVHRLAQLAMAIVFLLTAKLIDWRDRWSR